MRFLITFLVVMVFITTIFWVTDLDIQVAGYFYHPEAQDVWLEGDYYLWDLFYQLGPIISVVIAVGSVFMIMLSGLKQKWNHLRIKAIFILICFVVGPGLIVNTLFKDNWGRPRPAQITAFGGNEAYVPPLMYNASGDGKSFSSGHSSVGSALIAFFFLFRKNHLILARLAVVFSLMMGAGLGLARMAAGGHFLSDVLWSAMITFLVSLGFYTLFKEKIENNAEQQTSTLLSNVLVSGIAFVVLAFGLFNWPVKLDNTVVIDMQNITELSVNVEPLELTIISVDNDKSNVTMEKHIRGFGLPKTSVNLKESKVANNIKRIELETTGYLSEIEGEVTISVPKHLLSKVKIDSLLK